METMTATETDKRIDELSKRVDFGFAQVDRRFEQVDHRLDQMDRVTEHRFDRLEGDIREIRADMKAGFAAVNASIEGLRKILIFVLAGIVSSAIAGIIVAVVSATIS